MIQSTPFQLSLGVWIIMSASLQNIIWIISCVRCCKLLFPKYESVRSTGCPLRPLANCFVLRECWKDNGHQKPIEFTLKKSFLNHLINMQCSFLGAEILKSQAFERLVAFWVTALFTSMVGRSTSNTTNANGAKNACQSMAFLNDPGMQSGISWNQKPQVAPPRQQPRRFTGGRPWTRTRRFTA